MYHESTAQIYLANQAKTKQTPSPSTSSPTPRHKLSKPDLTTEPAVLIIDEAGYISFANRYAYNLLHTPPKPLWGQHYHTLFPAIYPDTSTTAPTQKFALTLTYHGRPITANLSVSPITGLPGASQLFTITIPPHQASATPTLNHLQRLAGLGTLTATTAHELNNPISIITTTLANAQALLDEDPAIPREFKQYLKTIEKSAWRCARLIDDLRVYTHRETPDPTAQSLNAIVTETLEMLASPFTHDPNITFHTNLTP
ncbi:MAG TPA: histidine kinase dimerization/phospho-acceptor domain-containing protein, partial [Anaerolineae bacterium]|nr:histidine kinase dimerization/phospho-acceptor domain-containing protein [Anaerolineae bacterium]